MKTKKVFSIIRKSIALLAIFGLLFSPQLSGSGRAIGAAKPVDAEWLVDAGEDHVWYQFTDNVLTIGGVGAMPDWDSGEETPWYDSVTAVDDYVVVIGNGITRVGNNSFQGARKDDIYANGLVKVVLSDTLVSIGDFAFKESGWIEIVVLKNPNPPTIGDDAFQYTNEEINFVIPDFAEATYLNSEQWKDYMYIGEEYTNTFLAYFVYITSSDGGSASSTLEYIPVDSYVPETVALTATPDSGYSLTSLTVTAKDGTNIPVENNSFTMPAKSVTVNAVFAQDGANPTPKCPNTGAH